MNRFVALACLSWCVVVSSLAPAKDFSAVAANILPAGVQFGMSASELQQARPQAIEGPRTENPNAYGTLMEVHGLGSPGWVSFWYWFFGDRLAAVLRTQNLLNIERESAKAAAQQSYSELVRQLGAANQKTLLRKGASAFVPVRADVWQTSEGQTIYYVATDKEMTVAVVGLSDFPVARIMLEPDPQRFPMEPSEEQSIHDIERPVTIVAQPAVPSTSPVSIPDQTSSAQATSNPVGPSPAASLVSEPTPASREARQQSAVRWLVIIIGSVVIIVMVALLLRARKA